MVVAQEDPGLIVIGDPRLLSGREGTQAEAVRLFAADLRDRTGLPVEFVDERLSTVEARRRAAASGSASSVDSLAACVLLEAYLAAR